MKKYPNTVAVALWNKGEVAIAKRKGTKTYDGYWAFPGGKVEKDESLFRAAQRELEEETGLLLFHSNMEVVDCIILDPTTEKCFVYESNITDFLAGQVRNPEQHKSHDWEWLTPAEVLKKKLIPGVREYIKRYKKQNHL